MEGRRDSGLVMVAGDRAAPLSRCPSVSPSRRPAVASACRPYLAPCILIAAYAVAGCASNHGQAPKRADDQPTRYAAEGVKIAADPVAYLRELLARCDRLEHYRLTFYRQERLGLFGRLGPIEVIRAAFRKDPFSVKFEWDDSRCDFYESVYVAGRNDDKLLVRERHGFLGSRPRVRIVNLDDPVKWGKAKNPVTSFGLAQVSALTLEPFDDPEVAATTAITYDGIVNLDAIDRPAHRLTIQRRPGGAIKYAHQDFYIDADTLLPAGTDLWLPNGLLDVRYRYAGVRTDVTLTDADFRLSKYYVASQPATRSAEP